MSKFVEAAVLKSSASTDSMLLAGIPGVPGLAVPGVPQAFLPGAPQLAAPLAADAPPLGLPALAAARQMPPSHQGLGTSASELQPGIHSEAADPGLQVVEPPLIGRPTVIAAKDLLQQLETIGSWEDKDDDGKSCRNKSMKLMKKPSVLMKKPCGQLADGEVPTMALKPKPAASGKRLQLGCSKCRGCKTGCSQCRKPSYKGKRGRGKYKPRY